MNKAEVLKVIRDSVSLANNARPDDSQIPLAEDTPLFGENGHLDSMGLVSLLLDIEDALLDNNIEVALSDERAMAQTRSPFHSVATLADYTLDLIDANKQ